MSSPSNPAWLAFVFLFASAFGAEPHRPFNVLFIISDDLRPELGCYGVEGIKTPNLDALAARSVRFNRALCQYALCNPQRTSMLVGLYPTQTGVMDNLQWWGLKKPGAKTLPRWFRDHGYATLRAGKIFHGGIDDTDAWVVGGEPRRHPDDASEKDRDTLLKTKAPGRNPRATRSDRFEVYPGDGETNADYRDASRTIELLKNYAGKSQPFFMACGFAKPHSPPGAPKKFYDLYDVATIPLPQDFAVRPTVPPGFPQLSVEPRNTDLFINGRDGSEAQAREMKRAYWASVSFMDANVGRVLGALDELGLRESTIVVFIGDHGYHLGEKGRWSKAYSIFDVATRVPLLIAAPGLTPARGTVCARTVEVINLYRTLADLCGLPAPHGTEGLSMKPLLRDPNATWDRPAFSMVQFRGHFGYAVTTDRWHYAEWDHGAGGTMLIDLVNDPKETKNLAAESAHARTAGELNALLARLPESSARP